MTDHLSAETHLPPLPKNDHAFFDLEGEQPDIRVWNAKSMTAYAKQSTDVLLDKIESQAKRIAELEGELAIWKQCHSAPRGGQPPPAPLRPGLERAIEIVSKAETPSEYVDAYRDRLIDLLDAAIAPPIETPAPLPSAWMAADGRVITASAKEAGERVAAAATASSEFSIPLYRGQSNA